MKKCVISCCKSRCHRNLIVRVTPCSLKPPRKCSTMFYTRIFSEIDRITFAKIQRVAINFKFPPPHELVLTSGGCFQGNADLCLYN